MKVVERKRLHLMNLVLGRFGSWKLSWVHCVGSHCWHWCLVSWSNVGKMGTLRKPERGCCWVWWNMPMMGLRLSAGLNVEKSKLSIVRCCGVVVMMEGPLMVMMRGMKRPWLWNDQCVAEIEVGEGI